MARSTRENLAQHIDEGSWTERAKSLERLATRFAEGQLSAPERHAAIETFRVVLYDSEPLVRFVLAESIKFVPDAPRDVVLALARDIPMAATPVLEHSRVLGDDDLLAIAQRGGPAHRFAIAGRRSLSERIAAALCRPGERAVILRLLDNDGAAIAEATLHALLDRFPEQPALGEAMARRRLLPVSVGARLLAAPRRMAEARLAPHLVWNRTGSLG